MLARMTDLSRIEPTDFAANGSAEGYTPIVILRRLRDGTVTVEVRATPDDAACRRAVVNARAMLDGIEAAYPPAEVETP